MPRRVGELDTSLAKLRSEPNWAASYISLLQSTMGTRVRQQRWQKEAPRG
jgi:hypothetical protein